MGNTYLKSTTVTNGYAKINGSEFKAGSLYTKYIGVSYFSDANGVGYKTYISSNVYFGSTSTGSATNIYFTNGVTSASVLFSPTGDIYKYTQAISAYKYLTTTDAVATLSRSINNLTLTSPVYLIAASNAVSSVTSSTVTLTKYEFLGGSGSRCGLFGSAATITYNGQQYYATSDTYKIINPYVSVTSQYSYVAYDSTNNSYGNYTGTASRISLPTSIGAVGLVTAWCHELQKNGWIALVTSTNLFTTGITEESAFMRGVLARANGSDDYWGDQVLCINGVIDGQDYNYIYASNVHGVQYRIVWLTPSYYY